jgi:predicted P-loop ATPase
MQNAVYLIECYLQEYYEFRRNALSGKAEFKMVTEDDKAAKWKVLTTEALNSIVRKAKKEDIVDGSPRTDIEEYIYSDDTPVYDPIMDYLLHLPAWDGNNHVADLFNRIPGLTSEQLSWCSIWLRSMVAHWMGLDAEHGNECAPVLIGVQGCGKTTFAMRLLPPSLRCYYMDHIYFANKFDSDMALTNNLLVNIDEFANMKGSQQGKLKQTLSKQKVNGRPIFGKSQEDRRRYASFIATTNDEHPLSDPTGSRRYICLQVPKGKFIDNSQPIDYEQLYAQVVYEIKEKQVPYWFTNAEVERMQQANSPYQKSYDLDEMITSCYKVPAENEPSKWYALDHVVQKLKSVYPTMESTTSMKIKIGKTLKCMGFPSEHTNRGTKYQLIEVDAA